MTRLFIEQPLALPGSAKYKNNKIITLCNTFFAETILKKIKYFFRNLNIRGVQWRPYELFFTNATWWTWEYNDALKKSWTTLTYPCLPYPSLSCPLKGNKTLHICILKYWSKMVYRVLQNRHFNIFLQYTLYSFFIAYFEGIYTQFFVYY